MRGARCKEIVACNLILPASLEIEKYIWDLIVPGLNLSKMHNSCKGIISGD